MLLKEEISMCKVVGVFPEQAKAQEAAQELRGNGYDDKISLVSKEQSPQKQSYGELGNAPFSGGDSITDGTATGGFVGGLAGMAVGAGALLIPGLGPIVAMGPIAGLLSGAVTGGVAGALVDYGIPETEGKEFEHHIQDGATLAIAETSKDKLTQVADLMRAQGASEIRTYKEH
jgi:outer membrane lipoprotein SlyB